MCFLSAMLKEKTLHGVFLCFVPSQDLNVSRRPQPTREASCRTHHVEDGGVLSRPENHLGLEAGLEVGALSRDGAASTTARERRGALASDTGDSCWEAPAVCVSSSSPLTHFLLL